MTREDIEHLIAADEGETVEVKETTGQRVDACETLCAFLNKNGGSVVFGVTRKGKLTGQLMSDSTKRDLFEAFQKFEPAADIAVDYVPVDETHTAIVCAVGAGVRRPYLYDGRPYKRIQSSTTVMSQAEYEEMLLKRPMLAKDWSAEIVPDATLSDLDVAAISVARKGYAEKHVRTVSREEVDGWPLQTFLDKARLTREGKITRTALLLVGKELSVQKLSPCAAQLVWKLVGEESANQIFRPPYLLATTELFNCIRNVQVRMVVMGTLRQIEVPKYSDRMVLEALHNCIAHQDYTRSGRVIVTEYVDHLTLESQGSFYYGHPEDYIGGERTPPDYRNPQLVDSMSELNMIDTMGYGIHRMFAEQAKRYMPLHDYALTQQSVTMTIYGHFMDRAYSSLLVKRPELRLKDILLLDRVQKKQSLSPEEVSSLRKAGLVEGRLAKLRIVSDVADPVSSPFAEIKLKRLHRILIDFLAVSPGASRAKINERMLHEIDGVQSERAKAAKITHIMTYLRRKGLIVNDGTDTDSHWNLRKEMDGKSMTEGGSR